jgi:hypothetical protein
MHDPASELPRIPLPRLSEKGSEQRSEGGFGRYEEAEMGRKEPSGRSVGYATGAYKTFRTVSPRTWVNRSKRAKR